MVDQVISVSPFRRVAERLLRDYRFTARLPVRFGRRRIRLSTGNHLGAIKPGSGRFQGYLLDYVDRFVSADTIVWDVGANMGMFAVPAAHRAKRVIAFEPEAFNVDLLNRTLAMNPDLPLDIVPVGLSNVVGLSRFAVAGRGRAASQLEGIGIGTQTGQVRQVTTVMTLTADWALNYYPAPHVVKCDAEGAEVMILEGASKLLTDYRPLLMVEVAVENASACTAIFHAHEYVIVPSGAKISRDNIIPSVADAWEVIAVPREKLGDYSGR